MFFKTKPRTVEARKVRPDALLTEIKEIFEWLKKDNLVVGFSRRRAYVRFNTGESVVMVNHGDWIVKTAGGGFLVYPPDAFAQTFEWIGPAAYADPPYLVN